MEEENRGSSFGEVMLWEGGRSFGWIWFSEFPSVKASKTKHPTGMIPEGC